MGMNKTKYIHTKPYNLKDEVGNDYYYLVVF